MPPFPDLYEASVESLQAGLDAGHFSSVDLVKAYFSRIEEVNVKGPALRAVIEINSTAPVQAAELDEERKQTRKRSQLHGIPVLLKDNIATYAHEGLNTTAGSYSLLNSIVLQEAGVVTRLKQAGAIILGTANMSEWAHFRDNFVSANGWSGRGGQATNAYYPGGEAWGSSTGSAIAASIGLTAVALGTETNGSITGPAAYNNVVCIKPTVGLTSRAGVIPISTNQDTIGPLVRCMSDAAIVLSIIAGKDPNDEVTLNQPDTVPDYTKALDANALQGKRLGVPRGLLNTPLPSYMSTAFEEALGILGSLGATVVDPADLPSTPEIIKSGLQQLILSTDFKVQINNWFMSLKDNPTGVRSLTDLIKFNDDHPELEKPQGYEGQSRLLGADATNGFTDEYYRTLAYNRDIGGPRGIDGALKLYNLDALVLPVWGMLSTPAALAGYPIVVVPLGFVPDGTPLGYPSTGKTIYPAPGIPFGLAFFGTAFSEFDLIGFGYAYEQKTQTRLQRKAFSAAVPTTQLQDVIGT